MAWRHTWQRPQQIASRLARGGRLLYVEPLGLRAPRPSDLPRLFARLLGRGARGTPGVTVRRAPLLGLPLPGKAWAAEINGGLLRRRVGAWMRSAGVRSPLVWVGTPSEAVARALEGLPRRLLVYDCLDAFHLFHAGSEVVARTERAIASSADLVVAASGRLQERMEALNPRTIRLPNGADYEHFCRAAGPLPPPARIARLPHPILGYVGEIADWFDVEAVRELAQGAPAASVVLVGPVRSPRVRRLLALPNVHFLGRVEYQDLPSYVAQFDVCLIPFVLDALTEATNPVKLYEYLATGKPIVTAPLPEVLPYGDVVTLASPGGWSAAVRAALRAAGDADSSERRRRLARENTWDQRLQTLRAALRDAAAERRGEG